MNHSFIEILEPLKKWENVEKIVLTNETELLCHVPLVAPEAWLHILYAGLSSDQITEFEQRFPIPFPTKYKEFLLVANGINIFSDSLSIWGSRESYQRAGEGAIQPYDLLSLNNERPKDCPNTWIFFGSYSWDGTRVMFDLGEGTENNKVYRCARISIQVLQEWSSFDEWLDGEVERLGQIFDEKGVKYDKKACTAQLCSQDIHGKRLNKMRGDLANFVGYKFLSERLWDDFR